MSIVLRRTYLGLSVLRRLPLGLLVPLFVRYPLQAGLDLAEVGLLFATLTAAVVACEVPTGGLADSWGRRPTLLLAASAGAVSLVLMLVAHSLPGFLLAYAATGVYWALDSGPLGAWYVDAALEADPGRNLAPDLARVELCENLAIATGALTSSALALVGLPLTAAVVVALGFQLAYLAAAALLVREQPGTRSRRRPSMLLAVGTALRAGWRRPVRLLLIAQICCGAALSTVELLWQPLTAAHAAGNDWIFGVLAAGGWAAGGLGALLLSPLTRVVGGTVVRAAAVLRCWQALALLPLAFTGSGLSGVAGGYLAVYLGQGPSDAAHSTLLHRRADSAHRATLLSLNSLVLRTSGLLASLTVGFLAAHAATTTALAGAATLCAVAAPLYLLSGEPPARRTDGSDLLPVAADTARD